MKLMTTHQEISHSELNDLLASGAELTILDIRESDELENGTLSGAIHIPMGEVPERYRELDVTKPLIVVCRSGARSGRVTQFLAMQGFPDVRNLVGGMNTWAAEIDPSINIY